MKKIYIAVAIAAFVGMPSFVSASTTTCTPVSTTIVSSTSTDILAGEGTSKAVLTYQSPIWTTIPGASWIWKTFFVTNPNNADQTTFVENFNVAGTVGSSSLSIAADDYFTVSINGTQIASENGEGNFLTPKVYDVSSSIVTGSNTLSITATNAAHFYTGLGTAENNPGGAIYALTVDSQTCTTTGDEDTTGGTSGGSTSNAGGTPSSYAAPAPAPTAVAPVVAGAFITSSTTAPIAPTTVRIALADTSTATPGETAEIATTSTSTYMAGTTIPEQSVFNWKCILIALILVLIMYICGEFLFKGNNQSLKKIFFYVIATVVAIVIFYFLNDMCPVLPLMVLSAILSVLVYFDLV